MAAVALTVIACYRAHEGRGPELAALVREHVPVLRAEGLVQDHAEVLLQAADGTLLEIFSWKSEEHARSAESNPEVQRIWGGMAACADFRRLDELEEAGRPFAHFHRTTPDAL